MYLGFLDFCCERDKYSILSLKLQARQAKTGIDKMRQAQKTNAPPFPS